MARRRHITVTAPPVGYGRHNGALEDAVQRLIKGSTYKDLSTVILCPTRAGGGIAPRVVTAWMGLMRPMNQQVAGPLFVVGDEVGDAYNRGIQDILDNPALAKFRYLLTLEDDVMPPPDGLLRLYESLEGKVDGQRYDVVGGLYWTKGEAGQPMIYGDPAAMPRTFIPQLPKPETVQPANGLGMGFNLWRLAMFRDPRLETPWFRTLSEHTPGKGSAVMTQDLYFYDRAAKHGLRYACDTRVRCGHYDATTDIVW